LNCPHLEYYLLLVGDLEELARYVEIDERNYRTFSVELVRLLLATGSEIDVVAKLLCARYPQHKRCRDMDDYRKILSAHAPGLRDVTISMPRHNLSFVPWDDWRMGKNPSWWRSYNNVKHKRDKCYEDANLHNCLRAMAGLCVLVAYLYYDERISRGLATRTPMMFLDTRYRKGSSLLTASKYELPDFANKE
jgi:hypothetical protein